jgi:hypothetical protein
MLEAAVNCLPVALLFLANRPAVLRGVPLEHVGLVPGQQFRVRRDCDVRDWRGRPSSRSPCSSAETCLAREQ